MTAKLTEWFTACPNYWLTDWQRTMSSLPTVFTDTSNLTTFAHRCANLTRPDAVTSFPTNSETSWRLWRKQIPNTKYPSDCITESGLRSLSSSKWRPAQTAAVLPGKCFTSVGLSAYEVTYVVGGTRPLSNQKVKEETGFVFTHTIRAHKRSRINPQPTNFVYIWSSL
jgi:hypothetical protein